MGEERDLSRRGFLRSLAVGAVVALVPIACEKKGQVEEDVVSATGAPPADTGAATGPGGGSTLSGQRVYTREDPGAWGGKEDSHVPMATLTKLDEAGNYRVDVVVNHEMNPQKPHWIQNIALRDQTDRLLADKYLQATDPKAVATFTANAKDVETFKVYELCNLHGLWMAEYAVPA